MDLGNAQSNPTTPDEYRDSFYSLSDSLNNGTGPMNYLHPKNHSNAGSMAGSPRSCTHFIFASYPFSPRTPLQSVSHDLRQALDAAPQGHALFQENPLHVYEGHHYPASYSTASHRNNNGPPLTPNPSLLAYGEPSTTQPMLPIFTRPKPASPNGNDSGGQAYRHLGNPALYHFAFNGLDMPQSPTGDWNEGPNSVPAYAHAHGVFSAPPFQTYGPPGMLANPASVGPQQFQELYTHPGIQAQIQHYFELNNRAYGLSMAGAGVPHGSFESTSSSSGTGLGISAGGAPSARPQSQSTLSTPSLAGNSPTIPWSPSLEPGSRTAAPAAAAASTSTSASLPFGSNHLAPIVRGPPTPPKLVGDVMPPKATPKPRHRSRGANTSVSSVPSTGSPSSFTTTTAAATVAAAAAPVLSLRERVAGLPKDKRLLFERAAGDRWDPRSSSSSSATFSPSPPASKEDGLERLEVMFLEDLYALIASEELRNQTEIPDEMVEPILKTILLPKVHFIFAFYFFLSFPFFYSFISFMLFLFFVFKKIL